MAAAANVIALTVANDGPEELTVALVGIGVRGRRTSRRGNEVTVAPGGRDLLVGDLPEAVPDGPLRCWLAFGPPADPRRFKACYDVELRGGRGLPDRSRILDLWAFGL